MSWTEYYMNKINETMPIHKELEVFITLCNESKNEIDSVILNYKYNVSL